MPPDLMADIGAWVLAAERAYVGLAVRPPAAAGGPGTLGPEPNLDHARYRRAIAAGGAVASRFLAVGTPRSFGIAIAARSGVDQGQLALAAHRTWFDPRDIRCAAIDSGGDELAAATGGRLVSLDEALACDIVCVLGADTRVEPRQLRRGTHVNVEVALSIDQAMRDAARVVSDEDLSAIAAGLVDGRQLDELTIYYPTNPPVLVALEQFSHTT